MVGIELESKILADICRANPDGVVRVDPLVGESEFANFPGHQEAVKGKCVCNFLDFLHSSPMLNSGIPCT